MPTERAPARTATWAAASELDLELLRRQCRAASRPLLVDIDGPDATNTADEFRAVCTAPGTELRLLFAGSRLAGYLVLRDADPVTAVATVDFELFEPDRPADAGAERALATAVARLQRSRGLARLQMFVLATDTRRLARALALGFRREGVLRCQYRHAGANRDLAVLARLADSAASAGPCPAAVRRLDFARGAAVAARASTRPHDLAVRPVTAADRATLSAWFGDPGLQAVLDDADLSDDEIQQKVAALLPADSTHPRTLGFVLASGDRPVGLLHFLWINWTSGTAEVDLFVGERERNSLLVGAALLGMARTAFERLELQKIYAFVYASNRRALRTLTRCMTVEACLASYRPGAGGRETAFVCGLLAAEGRAGLALMTRNGRRRS